MLLVMLRLEDKQTQVSVFGKPLKKYTLKSHPIGDCNVIIIYWTLCLRLHQLKNC